MTSGHPNTIAALIAGGLGTLTGYLLSKYAGIELSPLQTGALVTGYAAALLFVGRRGIKATALAIWNGAWNGTAKATEPTTPPSDYHTS
jgi:hypothetical protein